MLVVLLLLALLHAPSVAPTTAWADAPEQAVEQVAPGSEQQVVTVGGDGEADVRTVEDGDQSVDPQAPPSAVGKAAQTAARVAVGAVALAVAVASGIASLFLF